MPELDSVRGIAVFLVLIVHAFENTYGLENFHGGMLLFMHLTALGKVGVNLFFVLSGFLITGILLKSRGDENYFRSFYWKRACRILPPYLLIILLVLAVTHAWRFAVLSSLFLANVTEYFGVTSAYGPLWSLAVEEHFYLAWPNLVRRLPRTALAVSAAFLLASAPILRYAQVQHQWFTALHATWFNWDGLALGALLRLAMTKWSDRALWRNVWPILSGVSLLGLVLLTRYNVVNEATATGNAFQISCWNVLFCGFMILMLLLGSGPWQRFANPRPLAFLGYISYGLYLYHLLVYAAFDHFFPHCNMFLRFVLLVPIASTVAWLSRRFYEEYFLRKKAAPPVGKSPTAIRATRPGT